MNIRPLLPKLSKILYGGDYNPEQWPEEVWQDDMRLMRMAGVNIVSIGIFSWARIQPNEVTYDFAWLDRLMDLLAENGICADLATATASPPPWMSRYPDLCAMDAEGRVWSHGSRQHFSPSSPTYRRFAAELVKRIATRYASHPALAAWHINNEYACHMSACHSEVSTIAFRAWLRKRYGTLDALNHAWGTAFWSQHYDAWTDILTPRKTPMFHNPCQALDYQRFCNDTFLDLCKMEMAILREITPDIPITTNFMGFFKPLDYREWAKHLDFTSWDSYPDPLPDQHGDAYAACGHDLTRSLKPGRPFVLMEQVTSHVNWRPVNASRAPGVMRLFSLQSVARGSDGVLFFQWRQAQAGAEKFHGSMVQHCMQPEKSRVFQEVCGLGAELQKLRGVVGSLVRSRAAIVVDWNAWWAIEQPSKPATFNYVALISQIHRYFYEHNIAVDFVEPAADLTRYSLVIAPCLYLLKEEDARNLHRYVAETGGTLLVTSFSGIVDENERIVPGGYPGYLRETLGLWVEEWWPMGPSETIRISHQPHGTDITGKHWAETVHLLGAEPIATFSDGHLAGRPALTRHATGKGQALYLATQLENDAMDLLLNDLCTACTLEAPLNAPRGIEVALREGDGRQFLFLLNHKDSSIQIPLSNLHRGTELLSGRITGESWTLEPNGAAVIELALKTQSAPSPAPDRAQALESACEPALS